LKGFFLPFSYFFIILVSRDAAEIKVKLIMAVIVSIFGGVVSAEDLSGGLKQSAELGVVSSASAVKNLDVPYIHQCWDTPNDFDEMGM
jgi:hypothetical protein